MRERQLGDGENEEDGCSLKVCHRNFVPFSFLNTRQHLRFATHKL